MTTVRRPAVAGTFYPGDPRELTAMLDGFAPRAAAVGDRWPKAVIAPHAGYVYSGPVAASVYARLRPGREQVRQVVLLGPSHRVEFRGVAAPSADAFATPLGEVPVDRTTVDRLLERGLVVLHDGAHADEHGLEVHLPFLQRTLAKFAVVPLVIGNAPYRAVASILREAWGGDETVVVISSDLSHYHRYDVARRLDEQTARQIEALDPDAIGYDQACGRIGIQALLDVARERGLRAERVDLRNSGDTAGPRDQVVGYGAFAFA